MHVARGVTTHGFAVNVDNDLQPFEWIVPCGLEGVRMTSVAAETGAGATGLPASASATAYALRARRSAGASGIVSPRGWTLGLAEPAYASVA